MIQVGCVKRIVPNLSPAVKEGDNASNLKFQHFHELIYSLYFLAQILLLLFPVLNLTHHYSGTSVSSHYSIHYQLEIGTIHPVLLHRIFQLCKLLP